MGTSHSRRSETDSYNRIADCGKSFLCHPNGIIISKTLFQCSFCKFITDSAALAQSHFETKHIHHLKFLKKPESKTLYDPLILIHECNPQFQCSSIQSRYLNSFENFSNDVFNEVDHLRDDYINDSFEIKKKTSNLTWLACKVCRRDRIFLHASKQQPENKYICTYSNNFITDFLTHPKSYSCPCLDCCMNRKTECRSCLMDIIANIYEEEEEFEARLVLRQREREI